MQNEIKKDTKYLVKTYKSISKRVDDICEKINNYINKNGDASVSQITRADFIKLLFENLPNTREFINSTIAVDKQFNTTIAEELYEDVVLLEDIIDSTCEEVNYNNGLIDEDLEIDCINIVNFIDITNLLYSNDSNEKLYLSCLTIITDGYNRAETI